MKTFRAFSEHWLGSWVINGLAVIAFILVLKLLASQFLPDAGVPGAIKAGIGAV